MHGTCLIPNSLNFLDARTRKMPARFLRRNNRQVCKLHRQFRLPTSTVTGNTLAVRIAFPWSGRRLFPSRSRVCPLRRANKKRARWSVWPLLHQARLTVNLPVASRERSAGAFKPRCGPSSVVRFRPENGSTCYLRYSPSESVFRNSTMFPTWGLGNMSRAARFRSTSGGGNMEAIASHPPPMPPPHPASIMARQW